VVVVHIVGQGQGHTVVEEQPEEQGHTVVLGHTEAPERTAVPVLVHIVVAGQPAAHTGVQAQVRIGVLGQEHIGAQVHIEVQVRTEGQEQGPEPGPGQGRELGQEHIAAAVAGVRTEAAEVPVHIEVAEEAAHIEGLVLAGLEQVRIGAVVHTEAAVPVVLDYIVVPAQIAGVDHDFLRLCM